MKKTFQLTAIAAALAGLAGPALADQAETKGGIKIKTDDGRFEAGVGGRIHFDVNVLDEDKTSFGATTAGSETTPANSSTYIRRVYLTLKGKAYGWNYKIESDFANDTQDGTQKGIAFQDLTMSTDFLGGELIFGQFKPYRSMEDLTSSNDVLLIERPSTSSNGVFAGREFQQGIGYKYPVFDGLLAEASVFSLRSATSEANEGTGYNARVAYAPLLADNRTVHVGVNYSFENPSVKSAAPTTALAFTESFQYAGRRGPTINLATNTGEQITSLGGELAASIGPFFLQGEYVQSTLEQKAGVRDQTVEAYYVQVAYNVFGENKPYKKADGVFGSVKPNNAFGAFEVVARYDASENKDATNCTIKTIVSTPAAFGNSCQGSAVTTGLNWYANPNVRFMFNYIMGKADAGTGGTDEPTAYVARAQFAF